MVSVMRVEDTGVRLGEVYLDEAFPAVHAATHFQLSSGKEINSFILMGNGTQWTLRDFRTQSFRFDQIDLLTLSA
jgi:CHAT domain-containing protein